MEDSLHLGAGSFNKTEEFKPKKQNQFDFLPING
jgi:hypothetical protein